MLLGSSSVIHLPSFIKIDSGIQKFMGVENIHRKTGGTGIEKDYFHIFKIRNGG
jgi:hypothetical protein